MYTQGKEVDVIESLKALLAGISFDTIFMNPMDSAIFTCDFMKRKYGSKSVSYRVARRNFKRLKKVKHVFKRYSQTYY